MTFFLVLLYLCHNLEFKYFQEGLFKEGIKDEII